MTTEEELVSAIFAAIPTAVATTSKIAADPRATVTDRLKAIELLARVASAHHTRHRHRVDEVTIRKARLAFVRSSSFLEEVAKSGKSRSARSKAAKLMAVLPATEGH